MTLNLAMIGCGQIADAHLKAIDAIESAALYYAVDTDIKSARSAADRYGATHFSADYDEALNDKEVDAVVLCLPHHLHAPFSIRAAEAGKHVLVEKPMALNEAEAQHMIAAADKAGTQLSIGQSSRCIPSYWKAKQLLADSTIGRIINVMHQRTLFIEKLSTDWRRVEGECGGLYLPIFGSHDVDALLWIADVEPKRVWGSLSNVSPVSDGDSDGIIGLELQGGIIASIAFATRCKYARNETLFVGEEGNLMLTRGQLQLNGEDVELEETEETFTRQMRLFVEALATDREVPASGREVLKVVRTLDLVRAAHATGQVQTF